ncbi:MAG TPA: class I SAM-dependent methyltransferase, partial [Acidobacteriota bacterium]|nr:class I SAM-dependent methyltransferase [Acidobacteriota bacterium]
MRFSTGLTQALEKGDRSYNTFLGDWWYRKSRDATHVRAYRQIVDRVYRTLRSGKRTPKLIVDYACGTGGTIAELSRRFPQARIVGIDGSELMLELARHDLQRSGHNADIVPVDSAFGTRGARIRLVQLPLPEFSLPSHRADAVLFLFPNMNFSARHIARLETHIFGDPRQCDVARFLSRLPDLDRPKDKTPPKEIYEDLLYERAMSRNIHQLLKRGGWWFKVDYSNCLRHDLSDLIQWRMLFSESALDVHIEEEPRMDPFEFVQCTYHRSPVIRDVYEQTHDKTD